MGDMIQLATTRTQCIGAYLAKATGTPRGGLVVVQEIFGVNAYVRSVADRFAALGYTAIAPAFFDHVEANVQLDYDASSFTRARQLVAETPFPRAIEDVASAAQAIGSAGKIGVIGFCWGGTVVLLAAIRLGLPAVSYYGARNLAFLDEAPRASVQFHFGERDQSIPPESIEKHRLAYADRPDMEIHTYPTAGHAFDRDVDAHVYDSPSAQLARERALAFFARHLDAARE